MSIYGKRNKYREVPLNSTAREALTSYVRTLPDGAGYLFPSRKRGDSSAGVGPVGERALIYIVSKYADQARVRDLSPHDLRHRSMRRFRGVVAVSSEGAPKFPATSVVGREDAGRGARRGCPCQ